jgi:putative Mn2+ efflux pump MntP
MGFVELLLLAVGLSMDACAVSICKGLGMKKATLKEGAICGIWFGGFQALMPAIGYFLGNFFADMVSQYAHWVAFILLAIIGGNMIKESFEKEECDCCGDAAMDAKTMFVMAIATSIDAMAVGVSFAFLQVKIIPAVTFIGVITFICSGLGVKIGSIFGSKYKSKAELAGGIVLILMGTKTLLEGLGIL